MTKMIILILIFAAMAFLQLPDMIRNRYWKELVAYCVFYMAAFVLCLLYVLDVPIPSMMKGVAFIFDDVFKLKY